MERKEIIMNFGAPPSPDDLTVIARYAVETLPDELLELCDALAVQIEEVPDETLESELDLEDRYELVALYRNGKEISPGVEKKAANDDDALILFRRPLLDLWAETGEDLGTLVRDIIIEEVARNFDFSDDEITEMAGRPYREAL